MTVSRDRVIRVSDAWPVLGVGISQGISTYACSSCCAVVVQEFGWTGTLQSDLLVYPDILEECRSEESMEESVRTVSGSRVGVVTTDMRCRDR